MSLFGSKEKITVFSTVAALMQSNEHAVADAVLYAILSRSSITYSIINVMLTGMGIKADQVRRYARDNYTLGLSQGGLHTGTVVLDDEDVADVIAVDLSLPDGVLVTSNYVPPLAFTGIAKIFLLNHRGYNVVDNSISIFPSGMDMPAAYYQYSLTYFVTVNNLELIDVDNGSIEYLIKSCYTKLTRVYDRDYEGEPTYETIWRPEDTYSEPFSIPADVNPSKEYLIAAYYELDGEGTPGTEEKYWFYQMLSNKYPELNPSADIDESNNTMPTIPIRYNNAWVTGDIKTTGTQLLRRMSLSWDDMVDKLSENPNIADIDHAYIMFGIDLQDPSNVSCQYLTEFFDYLADLSKYTPFDNTAKTLSNLVAPRNNFKFYGRDAFDAGTPQTTEYESEKTTVVNSQNAYSLLEHGLQLEIAFNQITSCIKTGSIGTVGTATQEATGTDFDETFFKETTFSLYDSTVLILRHQITENAYKEVRVYGLIHRNSIYSNHEVVTSLANVIDNENEHNFVIPIHYNITKQLGAFDRNMLFEDSLRMIINGYEITEVQWYSRGFFKGIVFIIAVIIIIWTGQVWVANLVAAMEIGVAAILEMILMNVIIGMAIAEGFKMVAEMIGPEFMAIFGVLVAALSFLMSPGAGIQIMGQSLVTAETLLSLSASAFKAAQAETTNLLEDIGAQYDEFLLSSEADTKRLEEAQSLLDSQNLLVHDLISAQNVAYTSHPLSSDPTKFYNSTIHIGNVGTMVLDMIPNFVDLSVKLPKPDIYAFGNSPSVV